MSCNCQHRAAESPEQIVSKVKKGTVKFCDVCDPCNECVTNVKICAFVVPTLEEGRYFKNSFIFVQEDDSVYFISDDRSEIPFGSRPKFIDDFDPTDAAVHFKSTVVYDVKNNAGYVYDPQGNMTTIAMSSAPFSSLTGGEGIIVTATGGDYTVAIDPTMVASADDLHTVTLLVTNHTGQINALQEAQDTMAGDIETIEDDLDHTHDLVDDANELAVEAKENAAAAQQTANEALSGLNNKQDRLTAGDNISILNNEISATDTTYAPFVGATGSTSGEAGLVPAPATTDAGKFLNANGSWEEVQAGGVTELTTADYNYPAANPDGVAMWLLDEGIYTRSSSVKVYLSTNRVVDTQYQEFIITPAESSGGTPVMGIVYLNHANPTMYYAVVNTNGAEIGSPVVLLTSNAISQSTGTAATTVMSQNAVTSMVFADPSTKNNVQIGGSSPSALNTSVAIGAGTAAQGSRSVGIGPYANTGQSYSVALGASSSTSSGGEVSIGGANLGTHGYNNSSYRLLTNVYDPQNDHDAATKGYVDGLVGNVALALNAINNGGGN